MWRAQFAYYYPGFHYFGYSRYDVILSVNEEHNRALCPFKFDVIPDDFRNGPIVFPACVTFFRISFFFLHAVLMPEEIPVYCSLSSVAAGVTPFGWGWLDRMLPHNQVSQGSKNGLHSYFEYTVPLSESRGAPNY